jgi:hypothetical protein
MKHTSIFLRFEHSFSKSNLSSRISFLISFYLVLTFSATFAQKLSDKQIDKFLDELQKEQIISEFGKDAFLKTIRNENNFLKSRSMAFGINKVAAYPDSIVKSRAAILGFIGVFELMRNVGSAADEMIQLREMSEKMLGERMFFKAELEGEINPRKPITFLSTELNLRPVKENYLTLANRLKAIDLIDQKVYDELIVWLQKDQIQLIKDFGFFIYAARQTYFYDNYLSLKNQQLKFIDSLQTVNLLKADKAKILKESYLPFEIKSKIDILAQCENAIIIPAEQGNFTREEIYQNLFNQVKNKFLPDFNFNNLKVTEISKNDDEAPTPEMLGIPFANPFKKNQNSNKLSFSIDNTEYLQKADTDFSLFKTLQKSIPPDIHIDSSIIQTYAKVFSFLTGINNKDFHAVNNFLTDKNDTKRLIVVSNDYNPFVPIKESRKILLLVDSTQNAVFNNKIKDNPLLSSIFGEKTDFSNKFGQNNIKLIIDDFQKNNILPVLDNTSLEKTIAAFRFESSNRKNLARNLLLSFPQTIAKVNFFPKKEAEKILVFKHFISELSRVSHGKFLPEKITDNFNSEISKGNKKDRLLKISYRLNGKKYETKQVLPKVELQDEGATNPMYPTQASTNTDNVFFHEIEWIALVNKSLEEKNIDGQFFKLKSGFNFSLYRNDENYIFLTKSQAEYIEKYYNEVFKDTEVSEIYVNYKEQVANFDATIFAEALKREKMLSEDDFKTIDTKKAKEPSDILKNSFQVVVIDMHELLGKSNTELYGYILNKIGNKLLPTTKFSNLKYYKDDIQDSTQNEFAKHNISATIDGKSYEQTLFVSLDKSIKAGLDSLKSSKSLYFPSIGENQFKIINDYLTDIASPKRLVIVCDYQSPMLSFVLFDSTQATLVAETLPNNYVDFMMYSRQFSRDSLTTLLTELNQLGLVNHMTSEEKEAFIIKFRRTTGNGVTLLESLSKVVVQSNIWGVDSYKNVYKDFIDSLKTIARGQFSPSNLSDNFAKMLKKSNYSERQFKYGFMLKDKKYEEIQLVPPLPKAKDKLSKINYEYLDFDTERLINLINQALNDANDESMFYEVYSETEEDGSVGPKFIFLNQKQYRWLKNRFPEIFDVYSDNRSPDTDDLKEEK